MIRTPLACLALSFAACTADIRPDEFPAQPTPALTAQAHTLIERAEGVAGAARWRAHRVASVDLRDTWEGLLAHLGNPWPDMEVHVIMDVAVGGDDARAEFLEGKFGGRSWGLQDGRTYELEPGGLPTAVDNKDAQFILAALHYLMELPLHIRSMELLAQIPDETVGGKLYHRVLGSWSTFEPHPEADQYVLYFDPADGRLAKAAFTVRAFAGFAKGAVHYDDLRDVDGARFPHLMTITGSVDDDPATDWLHVVKVKDVRFDVVKPEALTPLAPPGT